MKGTILRLKNQAGLILIPIAPFSFDPSMHKPDHFPSQDTKWEQGIRWQTMLWQGKPLGLKFENIGTIGKPKIKLNVFSEDKLEKKYLEGLKEEINYRYDFNTDLTEFNQKFRDDKQLGPIIKKWPGMRIMSPQSLYEYLVIGIMLQNCTVGRSVNMMQILFEKYGKEVKFDGNKFFCFWEAKILLRTTEEQLRALKVGYRAKSLLRITEPFAKGEINEISLRKKDEEEQRETLISLYGVGPATVGYILFDVFKHYAELRHISPWEQKIYSKLFFDKDPENPVPVKKLLKHFEKYGNYKQLAVHYIWEDLWWKRKNEHIPWLEKLIRV
ncbi:hypothetical protein KKD61_04235 [Patescibacteria group bacterium]|nr:hypothetical protein [Patescibacteria group bacterium]